MSYIVNVTAGQNIEALGIGQVFMSTGEITNLCAIIREQL
jgi:hypothetical protein